MALDWTLDLLFGKDLVRLVDFQPPTASRVENEAAALAAPEQ